MATACTIRPKVKNAKGELVESYLHNDLLAFAGGNTEMANSLWAASRTEQFKNDNSDVRNDVNGEPRIESFLASNTVQDYVSPEQMTEGVGRLYSEDRKGDSVRGVHMVSSVASSFNQNSPLNKTLEAQVEVSEGTSKVVFNQKDDESAKRIENLEKGEKLYDYLRGWWLERGFAVDALDEAEEGAGINAVTDFSATRRIASGLPVLIRVAKGSVGEAALPEETAHAVIAALHGKDAAVDRAIQAFVKNDELVRRVLGDMYDTYHERYKGDMEKLAHEAVGQLLAEQIKQEFSRLPSHSSLINRLKNAILEMFSAFDDNEIEKAYKESLSTLRNVAQNIIKGDSYKRMDFGDYAKRFGELFQLTKKGNDRISEYLDKLIESIEANIRILQRGKNTGARLTHKETTLTSMRKRRAAGETLKGILSYMTSMNGDLEFQMKTFEKKLSNKDDDDWTGKASIVYNVINITNEYRAVIGDFYSTISEMEDAAKGDAELEKTLKDTKDLVAKSSVLCDRMNADAHKEALPVFVEYSKLFCKDNVVVPFGEAYGYKEGETVSLENTIHGSLEPTFFEQFLSASMSSSFNIQSIGRIITMLKEQARQEVVDYVDRLKQLTYDLEKAGYTDQEWMFARNNGVLTGKYIDKKSEDYQKLSDVQKRYYDAVLEIKEELDGRLPEGMRALLNAPKIRKDFLEIIKNSDDKLGDLWDKMKDFRKLRSDDSYALEEEALATTYDGRTFRTVPLRFIAFAENEKKDNLSTDIVETLSMYAQMACNFAIMHEAMPALELAREELAQGSVITKAKQKTIDEEGNETVEEREISTSRMSKSGGSREISRINDLYEDQLYGIKMKPMGNIPGTEVSVAAVAHNLMAWTALNQYAMNPLGAVQNEITGLIMSRIEASGGEFFNHSDLTFAHGLFTKNLPVILGELGDRIQTSKFNLFYKRFNVLQEDQSRDQNFNRRNKAERALNSKSFYWMTDAGEFNLHGISALAIAHHMKLKDKDGNDINLWDALEVVDMHEEATRRMNDLMRTGDVDAANELRDKIDKHPEWKNSEVKKIVLKEGVTKADGTAFTEKDFASVTRKMMQVNHRLHGVYNEEDRAAVQRNLIGQLCLMYRKWIFPGLCRRFENLNYNQDLNQWTEGYYQSFWRFYYSNIKQFFGDNHEAIKTWDKLSDIEKANIKKAWTELGMWSLFMALGLLMRNLRRKDKKHSWYFNCLYYWAQRTSAEMNAYVPLGMPSEMLRVVKSPSAVLSTMDGVANLTTCLSPFSWEWFAGEDALVKSGRYKGMSKGERAFWKSPIVPGSHQWFTTIDPLDAAKFYESF